MGKGMQRVMKKEVLNGKAVLRAYKNTRSNAGTHKISLIVLCMAIDAPSVTMQDPLHIDPSRIGVILTHGQ